MKNTIRKSFDLGKIDWNMTGRKINRVTVDVELRTRGGEPTYTVDRRTGERNYTGNTTPEYQELSICANVWNGAETDCVCCGQCLDDVATYRNELKPQQRETFNELYHLWKRWHLNGMHAGTPKQEAAIAEWKAAGNKYDYTAACDMLKAAGLYEVIFTGLTAGRRYEMEPYEYGHGWIVEELPPEVVARVEQLLA